MSDAGGEDSEVGGPGYSGRSTPQYSSTADLASLEGGGEGTGDNALYGGLMSGSVQRTQSAPKSAPVFASLMTATSAGLPAKRRLSTFGIVSRWVPTI